jgi:hypothetical protein
VRIRADHNLGAMLFQDRAKSGRVRSHDGHDVWQRCQQSQRGRNGEGSAVGQGREKLLAAEAAAGPGSQQDGADHVLDSRALTAID